MHGCMQVLPLDEFIFNTEAHPLPLPGSKRDVELQALHSHRPEQALVMNLPDEITSTTLQLAIDFYQMVLQPSEPDLQAHQMERW